MAVIKRPLSKGAKINHPRKAIIHAMAEYIYHEGKWRHAGDFLEMIGLSAHILITPDGDIIECRDVNRGAYHAKGNNAGTVGAEWLVKGRHDYDSFIEAIKTPYLEKEQLEKGCDYIRDKWVKDLMILNHARHSDIDPGRKVDPGKGFPWEEYLGNIGVIWR